MKKMVEVEYVGIEDIQEIIDDAYAIMLHTKHYISVDMKRLYEEVVCVSVYIMLDGFDTNKLFDYHFDLYLNDNEKSVAMMHSCNSTLKNLLKDE